METKKIYLVITTDKKTRQFTNKADAFKKASKIISANRSVTIAPSTKITGH